MIPDSRDDALCRDKIKDTDRFVEDKSFEMLKAAVLAAMFLIITVETGKPGNLKNERTHAKCCTPH